MQLFAIALLRESARESTLVGGVDLRLPPSLVRALDLVSAGEISILSDEVGVVWCRKKATEAGEGSRLATNVVLGEGDSDWLREDVCDSLTGDERRDSDAGVDPRLAVGDGGWEVMEEWDE